MDELKVDTASPEKPKDCLPCRLFNGFSMIGLGVYTLNIPCISVFHKVCMVSLSSVFTFVGSAQLMKWDVYSALKKQTKE